jgi:hypothetical protein
MKKILRLVTTSVLTLTLVACGEASSSVSSSVVSSTPASSVSSTSAFANVSTITLSAASDALTQVMGTQKAVVVAAALNANTNPNLALEWFVNGTKSNQTGRVFEYTPAAAGSFVITARVGTVLSNALTLTVGAPVFAITGEIKVVSASKIEVTAPGGAIPTVTNNTVEPTSFYDFTKGVYVIDLKTALVQGASATLTLTREGSQTVTRIFEFDTRKLEVNAVTASAAAVTASAGVYEVTRPHTLAVGGGINVDTVPVIVTFKSEFLDAASVAFKRENISVPAGATAQAAVEGLVNVATNNAGAQQFALTVTRETIPGDYVYRLTLGAKTRDVTIRVLDTAQKVAFDQFEIATKKFDLRFQAGTIPTAAGDFTGIAAAADGSYSITKDYLLTTFKEFSFKLDFTNFLVPTALLGTVATPNVTTPNQIFVSLAGPSGIGFMRVDATNTQVALPVPVQFRSTSQDFTVTQKVDNATPVGDYTYTVRVLQLGVEIARKEVVVKVVDPIATLSIVSKVADGSDAAVDLAAKADGTFEVARPLHSGLDTQTVTFAGKIDNYQSPINQSAALATSFIEGSTVRDLLSIVKSNVSPMTIAGSNAGTDLVAIKLGSGSGVEATVSDRRTTGSETHPLYQSTTASVTTPVLFTLAVDKLTVLGTYTFNLQIGNLSKVITLNVVNPTPKVNMTVTGATLNSTDGKYYATLPSAGGTVAIDFALTLEKMRPATAPGPYTLPFTLVRKTPDFDNTIINTVAATDKTGDDGDLESVGLIAILENENATGEDPTSSLVPPVNSLVLSKAGTYTYTLTAGGATQTLTIVILGYPTVSADAVLVGTTSLVKFGSNFLVPSGTASITVHLKGTDLPAGDVWAKFASEARQKLVFTNGLAPFTIPLAGGLIVADTVSALPISIFATETSVDPIGSGTLSIWFAPTPAA